MGEPKPKVCKHCGTEIVIRIPTYWESVYGYNTFCNARGTMGHEPRTTHDEVLAAAAAEAKLWETEDEKWLAADLAEGPQLGTHYRTRSFETVRRLAVRGRDEGRWSTDDALWLVQEMLNGR